MHTIVMKGATARLQWGYYPAAELAAWSVSADPSGGGTLTATVIQSDALRVAQQPLTLVVPRPQGSWRWSVASLQIAGTSLTATVRPQE